jgi:hypothetical protein
VIDNTKKNQSKNKLASWAITLEMDADKNVRTLLFL